MMIVKTILPRALERLSVIEFGSASDCGGRADVQAAY